jgi:hypothetical protein
VRACDKELMNDFLMCVCRLDVTTVALTHDTDLYQINFNELRRGVLRRKRARERNG